MERQRELGVRFLSISPSLHLSICLTALVMSAGCEFPGRGPQGIAGPYTFTAEPGWPRVEVYGGLDNVLPDMDPTPTLELLLLGPRSDGRVRPGAMRNAQGLAHFGDILLVCDQGQPDLIAIHLPTGRSRMIGRREYRPRCPVDVAVDEAGRVYVADTTLHAVVVYDATMRFLAELRPPEDRQEIVGQSQPGDPASGESLVASNGGRGSEPRYAAVEGTRHPPIQAPPRAPLPDFRPCGLLVRGGVLYVGNLAGRRVDRWDIDEQQWLEPLQSPGASAGVMVAPAGLDMMDDGTLLIADAVLARIYRLAPDGEWLPPIGRLGRLDGEFVRPKQVRVTPSGLIFVSDAGRQSVKVFDGAGRFLLEVHEHPDGWRGFTLPMGLAVVPPDELPMLTQRLIERGLPVPDECVIVSDSLGYPPLTILGVFLHPREEAPDGA